MRQITLLLTALLWVLMSHSVAWGQSGGSMETLQGALEYNPTNQSSTWVNPDTGGSGTVTPVRTYANGQGQPCREFQQTIIIDGREEQGYGTACRQPDGSWQVVSGQPAAATTVVQGSTVYVREVPARYYSSYYPYAYPYYPYGYYNPWGYAYPYGYPFNLSLSLGYFYSDGKYYRGHSHGGHYYKGYKGGHYHKGGHYYKGYKGGHSYKGGHGGGGSYKGGYKGGGSHRR